MLQNQLYQILHYLLLHLTINIYHIYFFYYLSKNNGNSLYEFYIHRGVGYSKRFDENCDSVWFRIPPLITGMFSGCESLKSLEIPEGITLLPSGLVRGCTSLEKINIPFSVTKTGSDVFEETPLLTAVSYGGSLEDYEKIEKNENYMSEETEARITVVPSV